MANGEDRATQAVIMALQGHLGYSSLPRAVLCTIRADISLTMSEIETISAELDDQLPEDCYLLVSSAIVESMQASLHVGLLVF